MDPDEGIEILMSGLGRIGLVRDPRQAVAVTFLELFFDLAYVFAFTRLSQELYKQVTWHGAWETLVSLLALWWIWSTTVWMTERLNPDQPTTQIVLILIMFGALVLAAAVPEAFGRHGMIFAVGYVSIQLVRNAFQLFALRGHPLFRVNVQALVWTCASGVLWLVGGAVTDVARELIWSAAILLDYAAATLGFPLPRLGHARFFELPVGSKHLSERYRQFLIIALGDMILVTASSFTTGGLTANRWAAFVSAFVTTVLLWRIYIYRAGEMLGEAFAAAEQPTRFGLIAANAHLVMVVGIVLTTVANELTISHPFGDQHLAWTAVIVSGPAVFLAGRALFEFTVFGRVSRARLAAIAAVLVAFPAAQILPLVLTAALINVVLLALALVNAVSWRYRPAAVRR
jgi:low temperature requirement protein LtrA